MIKVGDIFKTIRGDDYIVVEYVNCNNVTVEFCDTYKHRLTTRSELVINGKIKNPYSPRLYNVGYIGVGSHRANYYNPSGEYTRTPIYQVWTGMLFRCYTTEYATAHLYSKTSVHTDWHCFQTFADWYTSEIKYTGWEDKNNLDKDILGDGSSYSPKTCCIVPMCINTSIANKHAGKYLQGVLKTWKQTYQTAPGYPCSNEKFNNEKSAHMAFVEAKSESIRQLANKYKQFLRPDVYETLMTKDFRYKFSPFFSQNLTPEK